jgi:hypothetical protein
VDVLNSLTLPAVDPTADNQATRKSWIDQQDGWSLADYIASGSSIKAWTGNPGYSTTGGLTSGQTKLNKLWLRNPGTLSTVNIVVTTQGSGLTSGQNFVAILDASGNQVAISADQTTPWATAGLKAAAMTTPYVAAAGGYYVAVLCNATTTAISLACHGNSGSSMLNFGLATASARGLQTATGQTSIPSSITLGSQTVSSMNFEAIIT